MRAILLLLLVFNFHTALSQNWEEIEIDDKVRMTVPEDYNRSVSADKIEISATTASGNIRIERFNLADSLFNEEYKLDILELYVKGFTMGIQNAKKIKKIEFNNEIDIQNVKARKVLLLNMNEKVLQIYFFIIDRKMYTIKFTENKSPSDTDREKIFSSIQIM